MQAQLEKITVYAQNFNRLMSEVAALARRSIMWIAVVLLASNMLSFLASKLQEYLNENGQMLHLKKEWKCSFHGSMSRLKRPTSVSKNDCRWRRISQKQGPVVLSASILSVSKSSFKSAP